MKKSTQEKEKTEKVTGQAAESGSRKRKHFGGSSSRESGRGRSFGQKPPQSNQQTQQTHRNRLSDRLCETCGKPHSEVCYRAIGACFNYRGTGHFAKDCIS